MSVKADFLVIGGGIAGLRAAISLIGTGRVVLLSKAGGTESNTGYAQGGIAAALGPDDSPSLHLADTLEAGAGLSDPAAAELLVVEGPGYVRELLDWGARFERTADGALAFGREGAHSVRRVLHASDATGREIARTLWSRLHDSPDLVILDHALATRLVITDGAANGVEVIDSDGSRITVDAPRVLLATGGAGQVFAETTNPAIASGDGLAMAWRAGARLSDLEFVQFHPTVLHVPGRPRFLVSEAARGEGAWLLNAAGERFMTRYDPRGELAPRDVVATAMVREAERTGRPVFLSLEHLDASWVRARFPGIASACEAAGLDLATTRLPVSPAAHYMCGGVDTDLDGRTSVAGLFAAGEVACTGVHGANRLASNSLLEGLVFGARAAAAMRAPLRTAMLHDVRLVTSRPGPPPSVAGDEDVPAMMWRDAGLVRDAAGLGRLVPRLERLAAERESRLHQGSSDPAEWRAANLARVGWMVARGALVREESRGGHRRADFPERDDLHWKVHIGQRRDADRPVS